MVAWKEPCPELLLNHLVALTPHLFYPSPPHYVFTTCDSFNGWREFGNRCRQFKNRRHGSCRRDRVRQPASSHCAEAGSRRCKCLAEDGVAGAARLDTRVFIDCGLMGFIIINLSEQDCLLMLPLSGYPNLAANECATGHSSAWGCGSGRAR
jgi:hypothetical protein